MNTSHRHACIGLAAGLLAWMQVPAVQAQVETPLYAQPASAQPLRKAAEQPGASASTQTAVTPAPGTPVPQVAIPLVRNKPVPAPAQALPPPAGAASASGMGDQSARCESEASEDLRSRCREQLARQSPGSIKR